MPEQMDVVQDLAREFRALGQWIDGAGDPAGALLRIAVLARETVPGCDWCAITQASPTPKTLAVTDEVAQAVDAAQLATGEGPCLSAARDGAVIDVPDLARETRWPAFTALALATTPVRSLLCFELGTGQVRSALNLYSAEPGTFTPEAAGVAAVFAAHAQVAVLHLNATRNVEQLKEALLTSRLIGSAVGILMSTYKLTDVQAFDLLRRTSQDLNRKVRDLAEQITREGTL